jgi:response regulator RpfG family c-di-GMP phosphodiesterase
LTRKKILIVDDEPAIVALLRASLPTQYEVFSAGDGDEGFRQALDHVPDLILSDLLMPNMDGYEMLKKLKSHVVTSHIPTIVLTAVTDTAAIFRATSLGASDYLMKPFQVHDVPAMVKKHV